MRVELEASAVGTIQNGTYWNKKAHGACLLRVQVLTDSDDARAARTQRALTVTATLIFVEREVGMEQKRLLPVVRTSQSCESL